MPEYLYPGVYVEEVDTGNKPIEGVSTSTVGFLGVAERGPLEPTLVTSFAEYTRSFGKYVPGRYLAYAVEGFFQNGGLRCFITRVVSMGRPAPAPGSPPGTPGAAKPAVPAEKDFGNMSVMASGPGTWGNRIAILIQPPGLQVAGPTQPPIFKLTIGYFQDSSLDPTKLVDSTTDPKNPRFALQPTQVEVFDNLTDVPSSSAFYERQVNNMSNLVTLTRKASGALPAPVDSKALTEGTDGEATSLSLGDFLGDLDDPTKATGLAGLASIDEISIMCCPDEDVSAPGIANALVSQCENMKDRFAILQAPLAAERPATHFPSVNSKYAAYYFPWLNITNPVTGQSMQIPPGGHMAGIYARSDSNRGVHKDPANEPIRGIDSLQLQINNQQQAILNPRGVNVLRYFKGAGNLVWGGRTTATDPDWKYINVRRLFIFTEKSIERGTQWVVFEPNDEPLWARVRRSVGDFLTRLWMDGMLQGATKEQAYFVRCDRTTMTQADIDNGRLICLIGIAPVKPAEFVIFRIGQWTGGSDVSEGA